MGFFAVIADDLTGAGDTGVQFANEGFRTRVFLGREGIEGETGWDVAVVNTDSRWMPPGAARSVLVETARRLKRMGVSRVYKKIDSTFRGNVAEETEALLDEFEMDLALIAPAFPANGRTVVGGYLLVNGEPVGRTAIARDPVCPVTESFLPALLASRTTLRTGHLHLSTVSGGPQAVADYLEGAAGRGERLIVADAVSAGDLENLAVGARSASVSTLCVGSAGLASQVARCVRAEIDARAGTAQVLVVCGSVNPKSREQVALLLREPGWESITVDPVAFMAGPGAWERDLAGLIRTATERNHGLRGLVLQSPGDASEVARVKEAARAMGVDEAGVPGRVAESLARAVAAVLAELRVSGFILTGGDTAAAVAAHLGSSGIDLVGEVSPGIPVGRLVGGRYGGFPVVTKAGGFGGGDALCEAARVLRRMK